VGDVFVFALSAAFNPTLVAATTVMMLLPSPAKLMTGYLLGALITSIGIGIAIVYALKGSGVVSTTKHTLSPAATTALGVLALIAAAVLARDARRPRTRTKREKGPPRWQQALGKGSPRVTFVVGALLTLPGASYLAGLSRIEKLNYPPATTVLVIVAFNLIMLAILEVSLMCFVLAPEWTPSAIDRAKVWLSRHGRQFATRGLTLLGALLVVKGVVEFLS
jgi:hypothetical protein